MSASGEEEVLCVADVEAAVGHCVRTVEATMIGAGAKRLLELRLVVWVREMYVNVPRDRRREVGKIGMAFYLVLRKDEIAHNAVAFALAANRRHPSYFATSPFRLARRAVL